MVDYAEGKKASQAPERGLSFGEIVGQRELKRALLAVSANDDLDGLLVRGEKGTAKSTAVRALADCLPRQRVVADCPYSCSPTEPTLQCTDCQERSDPATTERPVPLVTVPLGATRERVVGTLSVADALDGDHEFDPGLLARAHRGILYVDEVNLLDDHLVDVLLDAAAGGTNRVERDGVSVTHPAEFTLIGTMNPEEGDLRPQLRDRFALQATVTGFDDLDRRVAVIDRALGRNPDDEADDAATRSGAVDSGLEPDAAVLESDAAVTDCVRRARERLTDVALPTDFVEEIAALCRDAGVDGHRGDIAMARTARTFAALDDRSKVLKSDVREAAQLSLPHRLQSRPFEDAPDAEDVIDDHFEDAADAESGEAGDDASGDDASTDSAGGDGKANDGDASDGSGGREEANGGESAEDGEGAESGDGADDGDESGGEGNDSEADRGDGRGTGGRNDPTGGESGGGDGSHGTPADAGDRSGAEMDSSEGSGPKSEQGSGRLGASNRASDEQGDEACEGGNDDDSGEATPLVPGASRPTDGAVQAPDGDGQVPDDDGRAPDGDGRAPDSAVRAPDVSIPDVVDGSGSSGSGSRTGASATVDGDGSRVRTRRADATGSLDAAASVRAASRRGADGVASRDLRQSVHRDDASALVLFVVDASASMRPAMRAAKGCVLELLEDAYQERDEVGFVAFAGDGADVLLPPTDSVTLAARHLKDLPTGSRTPLPAGLRTASEVLARCDPAASVVVLVTDGRANVAQRSPVAATRAAARDLARAGPEVVVVDAGEDDRVAVTELVVEETDGVRVPLSALSADRVDARVGVARERER